MTNVNLISNPAAENGLTGWAGLEGTAAVIAYGTSGYPSPSSPGPADRGTSFFGGGTSPRTRLSQSITLPGPADVDSGQARFELSGWLGGYSSQDDGVRLSLEFLDGTGHPLGVVVLGPVTASERGNTTGLWLRSTTGIVPPGSRTARVLLLFTRAGGQSNDGYADSLSLTLTVDRNLVTNAGAENGLTGWTVAEGAPAAILYGSNGYPAAIEGGGSRFFSGGTVARSRMVQEVTLPTGSSRYFAQAWLGGWKSQNDTARVTYSLLDGAGQVLRTVVLGPVTAADRNNVTGLFQRTASGTLPVGARKARVEVLFLRTGGSSNDGYADNISLVVEGAG